MKKLLRLVPGIKLKAPVKNALVEALEAYILGAGVMEVWNRLKPLEQAAIMEAAHNSEGEFNKDAFRAKHGSLPEFETKVENRWWSEPTLLRLFLHQVPGRDVRCRNPPFCLQSCPTDASASIGDLSPDQTLLLENFADCDERREWSLSAAKALKSVEQGAAIAQFRSFLAACDPQPLPETVEGFLADIERRGNSCIFKAKALLLECLSSEVADLIAANPQTAKLCQRTRSRGLVVLEKNEETFRDALDAIGYGLPRV